MPSLNIINAKNEKVGTISLREDVFGAVVNVPLVHQVLKAQLASARQGTHKTKVKSEVRGGGRKPFKQKGTGNARMGSLRTPLRPGGGQNFGPQPRSYDERTPKQMVQGALRSVLSDRVKAERLMVIDSLELKDSKTQAFSKILRGSLKLENVLILDEQNVNLHRAGGNLPHVKVLKSDGINVYDVLKHEYVLVTKRAAEALQSRLALDGPESSLKARKES